MHWNMSRAQFMPPEEESHVDHEGVFTQFHSFCGLSAF